MKPNLLLLQVLTKNRNNIRDGVTKIQDVVTDYFRSGGKNLEETDQKIIEDFFVTEAPSNVESIDMAKDLIQTQKNPNSPYSIVEDLENRNRGKLFDESMSFGDVEKIKSNQPQTVNEKLGLGSLEKRFYGYNADGTPIKSPVYMEDIDAQNFPMDRGRVKNSIDRSDAASFIGKMRGEGISNIDIAGVRRVPGDEQKATAELVLQKNEMGANSPIKEEFFDSFTELKNTKGPRFFNQDFQGYESYGDLMNGEGLRAMNAISDDIEALGVGEDVAMSILQNAKDVARKNPNNPESWIAAMKQDLEIENINYSMRFWENYFDELMDISTPPKTRFRYGGLV